MKNISKAKLFGVKTMFPTVEQQVKFGYRLRQIQQLRHKHSTAIYRLDELFSALQSRAFKGELFGSSREAVAVD